MPSKSICISRTIDWGNRSGMRNRKAVNGHCITGCHGWGTSPVGIAEMLSIPREAFDACGLRRNCCGYLACHARTSLGKFHQWSCLIDPLLQS